MSFVSTGNKPVGNGGPVITTPPIAAITGRGESQKIWYYHTDLTGTVQEVTAPDGTLVWAGYQAGFGENRGDISNSGAYFEQPLRLPGQYYDEETGLHYNLFRYYAPECGRFISQDPISIRGGLNLYAYAPNTLSWADPLGLTAKADITTFYHAGDITGPIEPSKERVGLDFNPAGKGGFYVTTDKGQALDWATKRGHPSITQFDIPNSELAKLDIKIFDSASGEWSDFVTQGRQGTLSHNFDAVSGPMVENPGTVRRGDTPKPIGSQLAIFSDKAAALFDRFNTRGC